MAEYGFAFAKREHREQPRPAAAEGPSPPTPWGPSGFGGFGAASWPATNFKPVQAKKVEKPDIEKQAEVVNFLRERAARKPATVHEIRAATGVDLEAGDENVKQMLQRNPKVEVLQGGEDSGDTLYAYYAKYNVANRDQLLALVNRCKGGIARNELHDTYRDASRDIDGMVKGGEIIAINMHQQQQMQVLYPRGDLFLTRLPGEVRAPENSALATASHNPAAVVMRGEAVRIMGQWFRVSSEVCDPSRSKKRGPPVAHGESLQAEEEDRRRQEENGMKQPKAAQAPLSVAGEPIPYTPVPGKTAWRDELGGALNDREHPEFCFLLPLDGRHPGMRNPLLPKTEDKNDPPQPALGPAGAPPGPEGTGAAPSVGPTRLPVPKLEEDLEQAGLEDDIGPVEEFVPFQGAAYRHGVSKRLRELWAQTLDDKNREVVKDEQLLQKHLFSSGLTEHSGQGQKRPIRQFGPRTKVAKRRNAGGGGGSRGKITTNVHLEGTELGRLLEEASRDPSKFGTAQDRGGM